MLRCDVRLSGRLISFSRDPPHPQLSWQSEKDRARSWEPVARVLGVMLAVADKSRSAAGRVGLLLGGAVEALMPCLGLPKPEVIRFALEVGVHNIRAIFCLDVLKVAVARFGPDVRRRFCTELFSGTRRTYNVYVQYVCKHMRPPARAQLVN